MWYGQITKPLNRCAFILRLLGDGVIEVVYIRRSQNIVSAQTESNGENGSVGHGVVLCMHCFMCPFFHHEAQ